jgi:hypothetical protein
MVCLLQRKRVIERKQILFLGFGSNKKWKMTRNRVTPKLYSVLCLWHHDWGFPEEELVSKKWMKQKFQVTNLGKVLACTQETEEHPAEEDTVHGRVQCSWTQSQLRVWVLEVHGRRSDYVIASTAPPDPPPGPLGEHAIMNRIVPQGSPRSVMKHGVCMKQHAERGPLMTQFQDIIQMFHCIVSLLYFTVKRH